MGHTVDCLPIDPAAVRSTVRNMKATGSPFDCSQSSSCPTSSQQQVAREAKSARIGLSRLEWFERRNRQPRDGRADPDAINWEARCLAAARVSDVRRPSPYRGSRSPKVLERLGDNPNGVLGIAACNRLLADIGSSAAASNDVCRCPRGPRSAS